VTSCAVWVDEKCISCINSGLLLLVAFSNTDILDYNKWMAEKIIGLRIFENEEHKFDKSVNDIDGQILVVSQFTLYGNVKKGKRPDFTLSLEASKAKVLYDDFVLNLKEIFGFDRVKTGIFGAKMYLNLVNCGPVTIIIDYP
jgi:D-tyrosyl-tRNA(Tyr) deacylase